MFMLSRSERGKMSIRFASGLIFVILASSNSMAQQSLQQLEDASTFERALVAVDIIKQRKKLECVMTTGDSRLCGCLSRMLPVDTYIQSYGSLASQGNSTEYERLTSDEKGIVSQCLRERR
jgi:hypothetical protein